MKKIISLSIAASALLLVSCGGESEEDKPIDMELTQDTIKSEARVNLQLIRTNIPSPNQLTQKLNGIGANYNKSMLNPSSKGSGYSGSYKQALGLGAFAADMGYASSYNQTPDVIEYLGQISKLSKDLGIETAFDAEMIKKINSNTGKADTVGLLMSAAFDKAERNLRSNQRVAKVALMVTGGWVEGLCIGVDAASSVKDESKQAGLKSLCHDLYVHAHAFEYVFDLLRQFPNDADCKKLLDEMKDAEPVLKEFGRKNDLGPADLPKLKEAVTALRNKILN